MTTEPSSLEELYEQSALMASSSSPAFPASADVNKRIGVMRGNITDVGLDAIVNAANQSLLVGGGVDYAIHRAAGPQLLEECAGIGGCPTGEARITRGYNLRAKHVIHTVGPVYYLVDDPAALLGNCYRNTLELAVQKNVKSLAFSCISTGVYGFPSRKAAKVACETVRKFMDGHDGKKLSRVVFVTFEQRDLDAYYAVIPEYFPPPN
ncbi:hypothetical protein EDB81DRAFT_863357 [Dactylonectria macrodidyma]|uniref:Macro domain-containing protein n=1 Tax=Dactylonectria macrodidyma TaxID=307937 RepID=A0A9P9CXR3_9HYPO|nr:hypothetical protein EDB81DRAFT_863357 [Dactylonectria macrodidyma]